MSDYTIFDATISTLTPLHIGTGRTLLHEYDYAVANKRTWRIDEMALLEAQTVDDPRLADQLAQSRPAELLTRGDFTADSGYFRYSLRGTPRSTAEGAQLQEQIKDAFDRPYLPGSSLKGALRTAIAWHAWQAAGRRVDARDLGRRRQWAAQQIERSLLGRSPNHDLLRALHVADSQPVAQDQLMIANVRVHHPGGKLASPIELEAIRGDTMFKTTLKIDRALFSDWARQSDLRLSDRAWLEQLPQLVQAHAADRIRSEHAWFGDVRGARRVHSFYSQIVGFRPGKTQFLLQLGWGTGWDDKTFGSRLRADERLMERVIDDYRLARGRRRRGEPFPKSRRLVISFGRDRDGRIQEIPALPLGWCLVELEERKR